jgi:hypothetical protein
MDEYPAAYDVEFDVAGKEFRRYYKRHNQSTDFIEHICGG